ncbi:MAG: hypothetical protein WCL00_11040 [Bacteroidota bacterium]
MFEELKKAMEKGIDYAFETKEKIEKSVKEFAKENNLNKDEAKKLLDLMNQKTEEARKTLEGKIVELQKAAIEKMNLVTKEDYEKLEARLKKLENAQKSAAKVVKKPAAKKSVVKSNKKVG